MQFSGALQGHMDIDFIWWARLHAHMWGIQWDAHKLLIWLTVALDNKRPHLAVTYISFW